MKPKTKILIIAAVLIFIIVFISGCAQQPIEEKPTCIQGKCIDILDKWFLNECRVEQCTCTDCKTWWECWNAWTGGNCMKDEECRDLYGTDYREANYNTIYKIGPTKKTLSECEG